MSTLDLSAMYFGYATRINDYVSIYSPKLKDIIEFGEQRYFSMIYSLTSIPSDMKSQLFDMGIDYEEISDFELFFLLTRGLKADDTALLLGDLDLSQMEWGYNNESQTHCMINATTGAVIDELAYAKMMLYLRTMHNIKPKIERAATKTVKRILIDLDRQKRARAAKDAETKPILLPLVSALMRYPGCSYTSRDLLEVTLYEFMDTVRGAQIYINSTSLINGSYSGFCDTSKINKKEFNWMRDVTET